MVKKTIQKVTDVFLLASFLLNIGNVLYLQVTPKHDRFLQNMVSEVRRVQNFRKVEEPRHSSGHQKNVMKQSY